MNEKLKQLTDEDLTEEEIEARAFAAQKFYKDYFEDKLQSLFLGQLLNFAEKATTDEEIRISQGIIAGLGIVDNWFGEQIGIVQEKDKKDESFEEITNEIKSV